MRALVTGGAGFIGSNLVHGLIDAGHDVVVLDNYSSGYARNLASLLPGQVIEGDIRDQAAVEAAMRNRDVVFHLAASVGNKRSLDHPRTDSEINVLGTINILEAARAAGVRKIVFSSSAGIFGELQTLPIAESHPAEPDTPYGASKLCAEKLCLAFGRLYGMSSVCLRYFNVYGPAQRYDAYGNVIPIFVFKALAGERLTVFGDGEQTRDFLHVADVVQANIRAAMVSNAFGAFNIGSATRVSINTLIALLRSEGLEFEFEHGPPRAGDVRDSLADISAARSELGFSPSVALRDGLRGYIEWARQEANTLVSMP